MAHLTLCVWLTLHPSKALSAPAILSKYDRKEGDLCCEEPDSPRPPPSACTLLIYLHAESVYCLGLQMSPQLMVSWFL